MKIQSNLAILKRCLEQRISLQFSLNPLESIAFDGWWMHEQNPEGSKRYNAVLQHQQASNFHEFNCLLKHFQEFLKAMGLKPMLEVAIWLPGVHWRYLPSRLSYTIKDFAPPKWFNAYLMSYKSSKHETHDSPKAFQNVTCDAKPNTEGHHPVTEHFVLL